jgi:hypothetical protein
MTQGDDVLQADGGGVDEKGTDEGPNTEDESHHGSRP